MLLTPKIFASSFATFFSLRTSLANASLIRIEKLDQDEAVKLAGMGRLAEIIMRVEARIKSLTRTNVIVDIVAVKKVSDISYFEYECVRYIYDPVNDTYSHAPSNNIGRTFGELYASNGLTGEEAKERRAKGGANVVAFPADSVASGIMREFTGYFYVYQFMTLWIWYYYAYYYMAMVLTLVIVTSGLIKVGVALQSQRLVLRMASFHGTAMCYRNLAWVFYPFLMV